MMKTYNVNIKKSDGTVQQVGVSAQDTTTLPTLPNPCPAALVALIYLLGQSAFSGGEIVNLNFGSNIDYTAN